MAWGEGDDRGWDGWMASLIQWTWVWANSRKWWKTGKPGVLQSRGSQNRTQLSDWTITRKWRLLQKATIVKCWGKINVFHIKFSLWFWLFWAHLWWMYADLLNCRLFLKVWYLNFQCSNARWFPDVSAAEGISHCDIFWVILLSPCDLFWITVMTHSSGFLRE